MEGMWQMQKGTTELAKGAPSKNYQEDIAFSNSGCVLFRNEHSEASVSPNFPTKTRSGGRWFFELH